MDPNHIALVFTVLLGLVVLGLTRRQAVIPFLFGAIFLPIGTPLLIGSLNFYPFRILILFAWLRLVSRREFRLGKLEAVDKLVLVWVAVSVIMYTLLWGTGAAFQNGLGMAFDALGTYFFFRCTIRDMEGAKLAARALAVIAVLVAVSVIVERTTSRNVFYVLGGVQEFTEIRDGSLRCQGPFGHSILAGTFGATLLPIFMALWRHATSRKWALAGIAASIVIVINSHSSGPVLTLFAGLGAMFLWPLRRQMRLVRWAIVVIIVGLHMVMKAPVWALIARVSVFGSSSGDHRYRLLDAFINNFSEWWLMGTQRHWEWGWVLSDASNNYVRIGINGGLLPLILFVCLIVASFKAVGHVLHNAEDRKVQRFAWALGVALFAHLVAFFGVNYWDQMLLVWYLQLAIIACVASTLPRRAQLSKASAA
jgi:hypothetical protein